MKLATVSRKFYLTCKLIFVSLIAQKSGKFDTHILVYLLHAELKYSGNLLFRRTHYSRKAHIKLVKVRVRNHLSKINSGTRPDTTNILKVCCTSNINPPRPRFGFACVSKIFCFDKPAPQYPFIQQCSVAHFTVIVTLSTYHHYCY